MYRDGDRHTWRGFLGLIDDEIKAICRSRAVLLRVRAPFRLWIVGENKREHMHVHTRKYTVRSSSMSISFANSFFFSHIETLYTYQENLCTPFLLLFLMIFCRIFFSYSQSEDRSAKNYRPLRWGYCGKIQCCGKQRAFAQSYRIHLI